MLGLSGDELHVFWLGMCSGGWDGIECEIRLF